ncbi:zf-HC2 domain-containing protein [Streptosporangium sp. NBC_01810]|nr:zf-HC2 domain-containing protein [Streptosporangium sp. NBC_01810]WSA29723.1 zf-HC2 domain-containing protein [Streptosporangium sp. NBC_01810]
MTCDEVRMSLGVYLLGALEPDERVLVEAHLAECAECAAELAELSGVATFLGRVSEADVAQVASPPTVVLDRLLSAKVKRRRTTRLMLALAASVLVVGLGGGTLWAVTRSPENVVSAAAPESSAADLSTQVQEAPGQAGSLPASPVPDARAKAAPSSAPSVDPQIMIAPSDLRVTGKKGTIRAVVTASAGQGATTVKVVLTGVAKGTRCRLDVIGYGGVRETAGNWTVNRAAYDESGAFTGTTTIPPEHITSFEIATAEGRVLLTVAVP